MRKLTWSNVQVSIGEYIAYGGELRELKHLSTCRKRKKFDSASSGERTRKSPNQVSLLIWGLRTYLKERLLRVE